MSFPELTPADHAALRAFAARHGRNWKARLRDQWIAASAAPELHRLRNSHGPAWLATFSLDQVQADA